MKTFKEMRQDDINEAKDFNRVQEVNGVKKIDKLLEQAYKGMNKLQYGKSLYMKEVNDGIVVARRALSTYKELAANGELDGPIQK